MSDREHLRVVEEMGRAPSEPPPDPLVGRVIDGRYEIDRVLGEGGMGLVYKAKHAVLQKPLAIKVLRPDVSNDEEIITRFRQEAQSATAIGNEHIIDISDFGTLPDGSTYFVMEYLEGSDLTTAIETARPMPQTRTVHIALQLCKALGAAHDRGIVHRDLKPDNIYLITRGGDSDFVKVLDFGIAKVGSGTMKLTKAGQVFGTPHYMSPEQCAGAAVDRRTDVYAIGVILYEMASGRVPFDADNLMGILTQHMYQKPIPPHELPPPVAVDPGLEAIILKCLAKKAEQRYQSMAELAEDLERLNVGATPGAVMEAVDRQSHTGTTGDYGNAPTALRLEVGDAPSLPVNKSKMPMWIGLAAVLLVGGAVAAFASGGDSDAESTELTPPPAAAAPAQNAPAKVVEAPEPEHEPEPKAEAPKPEKLAPVKITLRTEPEGAEVWRAGELLGNAPLEIVRPARGEREELTLRLAGYEEKTFLISSLTGRNLQLTLERKRRDRSRAREARRPAMNEPAMTRARRAGAGTSEVLDPWGN